MVRRKYHVVIGSVFAMWLLQMDSYKFLPDYSSSFMQRIVMNYKTKEECLLQRLHLRQVLENNYAAEGFSIRVTIGGSSNYTLSLYKTREISEGKLGLRPEIAETIKLYCFEVREEKPK